MAMSLPAYESYSRRTVPAGLIDKPFATRQDRSAWGGSVISRLLRRCILSVVIVAALPIAVPVTWRRQESVSFAMYRASARELTSII